MTRTDFFNRSGDPQLWLKAGLISGLIVLLYASVVPAMAHTWWNDPAYSHGLLIPPLAAYLAWSRRERVFEIPVAPDSRGLSLILLACLLFLVGKLGAEFFLSRISLIVLLAGLIWTFWGVWRLRILAFPLLLLATMVPIPVIVYNLLAAPLQLFASNVSTEILQLVGMPVYREGNVIHLPETSLGVAEACSGLRSLSSLTVLALLVGFLQCRRLVTRALLFVLAIPIAIGVNVLRVTGTALLADYDQELALGFYHSFSGWLVFLAAFAIVLGAAKLLGVLLDGKQNASG